MAGNIKIILEGRGPLTLSPVTSHVATGGEGSIYQAGDTAIKIYLDPKTKVAWNNVEGKINFFRSNINSYVVAPLGRVLEQSTKKVVGYYMDFVKGEPIARVFTNDFRKRTGFNDKDAQVLVERMREIIMFAHGRNALLIDANELGYFVLLNKKNGPEPRIIDVDSWVIDNKWPPQCPIMPSIRDWHTKGWNQNTDWFAWGVVTFQIFTGIHPYKGRIDGYKQEELERRMKKNASVFMPNVRLNHAVRDFSTIPGPLFDWYNQTFQHGKRSVPPSPFDAGTGVNKTARAMYTTTTASGTLIFTKLFGPVNDQALRIFPCGVVLLASGKLVNLSTKKEISVADSRDCEIAKAQGGWLKADVVQGQIKFSYIDEVSLKEETLNLDIKCRQIIRYENRLFMVTDNGLTEAILKIFSKPILTAGKTWGAMINSTRWFKGLGIQDTMGATYIVAPFGDSSCAQVRVRELDGLKPITAKAGNRFITIICLDKNGLYQKLELTFSSDYASYKIWQAVTDSPDLNIAILPKGVCATIIDDGEINIFVPSSGALSKIQDKNVLTNMFLANWEDKVVYVQNGNVWSVKMQ